MRRTYVQQVKCWSKRSEKNRGMDLPGRTHRTSRSALIVSTSMPAQHNGSLKIDRQIVSAEENKGQAVTLTTT